VTMMMMMMFHLVVVYSRSRHCATPRIDSSGKERAIPRTNEYLSLHSFVRSIVYCAFPCKRMKNLEAFR
jgi:hypothetical protein